MNAAQGKFEMKSFKIELWREMERNLIFAFLVIVGLNIGLKLPHIAENGLFLDEASAIFYNQGTFSETIEYSIKDPTPPLFYVILWGWIKCFGISEMSARFPALIFSSLAAGMIFLVGRRLGNVKAGFFAAIFFTLSNLHIEFAQEARSYALACFLLMTSFYLFTIHITDF